MLLSFNIDLQIFVYHYQTIAFISEYSVHHLCKSEYSSLCTTSSGCAMSSVKYERCEDPQQEDEDKIVKVYPGMCIKIILSTL